jgi:multidrug efflux pump subunit AcrB
VEFRLLSDQPTAVEHRIHHFVKCFIEAVVIVIIVGLFLMDWRSALVLATAIPLTVATLIGMQLLHIPLQQISIASLIIALGVLVDVPVVAADGINRELHRGEPRLRAAWLGRSICGTRWPSAQRSTASPSFRCSRSPATRVSL